MDETEYIAHQVVIKLKSEFPELEVCNYRPNEFFEGFFTDFGYPAEGLYYPVWDEPGHVIYIESPEIYWWNNDTFGFDRCSSDNDAPGMAILFLHEDGHLAVVDESDGRLYRLIKTREPAHLAEYLKLFFESGRQQLASEHRPAPCVQGIEVPFFRFPDDYSEKSDEMPTVPVGALRDLILEQVAEGRVWLCDFESLDSSIRDAEETLDGQSGRFETEEFCLEIEGVSGWQWYLQMIKEENDLRSERRPELLKHGFAIDDSLMRREAPSILHSSNWLLPYSYIDPKCGGDGVNLPICVLYNEAVFAPYLSSHVDPAQCELVGRSINQFIAQNPSVPLVLSLKLPSYDQQVEASLVNNATICQGPEIAKGILRLILQNEANGLERAEMRKAFIKGMREWK